MRERKREKGEELILSLKSGTRDIRGVFFINCGGTPHCETPNTTCMSIFGEVWRGGYFCTHTLTCG